LPSRLNFLLFLCLFYFSCIINFTIAIFLSLSYSLHFLSFSVQQSIFSLPTILSTPSHPLPHLLFASPPILP
jgi:hypothetical protein